MLGIQAGLRGAGCRVKDCLRSWPWSLRSGSAAKRDILRWLGILAGAACCAAVA
jgi:hypothetical protein